MQGDIVARGEPAQVPADEMRPWIRQRDFRSVHVPLHVLAEVDVVDRHPAGVDDVDEHQRVVVREMDVDVVRRVVGAAPGEFDALSAYLKRVAVGEGYLWHGPGWVTVPEQEPAGLLVYDPDDVGAQRGSPPLYIILVG